MPQSRFRYGTVFIACSPQAQECHGQPLFTTRSCDHAKNRIAEEVLAHCNPKSPTPIAPTAPKRTSGVDRLNQPSTSDPHRRDPPPHQQPTTPLRMATGAPGGSSDPLPLRPRSRYATSVLRTPKAPRRQERQHLPRAMDLRYQSTYMLTGPLPLSL